MTTQKYLDRAIEWTVLDAQGASNHVEVAAKLKTEFDLTDFRAKSLAAQAARRKRFFLKIERGETVGPDTLRDDAHITPSFAARYSQFSYPRIVRACQLGEIADAAQDETRHWTFTAAAFKTWRDDHANHKTGRKIKQPAPL